MQCPNQFGTLQKRVGEKIGSWPLALGSSVTDGYVKVVKQPSTGP
jgi:hypothetical protein